MVIRRVERSLSLPPHELPWISSRSLLAHFSMDTGFLLYRDSPSSLFRTSHCLHMHQHTLVICTHSRFVSHIIHPLSTFILPLECRILPISSLVTTFHDGDDSYLTLSIPE